MYLVDNLAAIQTLPNLYDIVSITICQQFKKKNIEKQMRTVFKA
jgi:hypothetical protein